MENILSTDFLNQFVNKRVPWGFGAMSETVFIRTYSRDKYDGDKLIGKETWPETIYRCINGAQKIGAKYTQEEAERLFHYMVDLKCTFAGRFLWQLGTSLVDRFGANGLINCYGIKIDSIDAFLFLFENLMLGGGVGYSVRREDVHELPKVKPNVSVTHESTKDADFIVPDSRQGWVGLLKRVLESYFVTGKSLTYSTILIREYGEPIKSFGGTASGPQILIDGIANICTVLSHRANKKIRSIDALDICNIIGSIVVAGNVRRSAQIAIGDPDDIPFLRAKRWDLGNIPNWRAMSNNTIDAKDVSYIMSEFWSGYEKDSGEPYGLFNLRLARKYGRIGEEHPDNSIEILNPCITGDTLVYVADGRGNIPIKELSDIGKDVDVFCIDNGGKTVVRRMRNPRITGRQVPILKISFQDGTYLRCTANHKLLDINGKYIEARHIKPNDRLKTFCKFEATFEDVFRHSNSNSQLYYWLTNAVDKPVAEHRLIAANHYNIHMNGSLVVHHKDHDGRNNVPQNLEIMTKEEHDRLHVENMMGDKNPMRRAKTEWSEEKWADYKEKQRQNGLGLKNPMAYNCSNEDIKNHAILLTKLLGRRFSRKEWRNYANQHGLPPNISNFRKQELGSIKDLSMWASEVVCGSQQHLDVRTYRALNTVIDEGYLAFIDNDKILVQKQCEVCGTTFKIPHLRREQSLCGMKCVNDYINANGAKEKRNASIQQYFEQAGLDNKVRQLCIFNNLKSVLGRQPFKKEWENQCRIEQIPFRFGTKYGFDGFKSLIEQAAIFNHEVVSVEPDGVEDVYNGTVDEFHNFMIGGFETIEDGKRKWLYFNNLQCGEIGLAHGETCCLSEIYLNNIASKDELADCAKLLYKTQKATCNYTYLHEATNHIVHKNNKIGVSITGICQSLDKLEWLDYAYQELRSFDKTWSAQNNWPVSIRLTTTKPSGTVSLLAGSTPGVHPAYARHYIRRIRFGANDILIPFLRLCGYHTEYERRFDGTENTNTVVVAFPCAVDDSTKIAPEMTVIEQLELVKTIQTKWADNAVSCTAYYRPEELPLIKEWLKLNYHDCVKSISFLRHEDHGFDQAPYEPITKQQYDNMVSNITEFNFDYNLGGVFEMDNLECASGTCPVK